MTTPLTGATRRQVEAAAVNDPRNWWKGDIEELAEKYAEYREAVIEETERRAAYLVPLTHRIIAVEDLKRLYDAWMWAPDEDAKPGDDELITRMEELIG